MTYTFKNTLANSEAQITQQQAELMVSKVFGSFYGIKQLVKLNKGLIDYIPVQDGRITHPFHPHNKAIDNGRINSHSVVR